ncbi:hypothetical protein CH063_05051, partial [Colletotrichum higginsianum]
ATTCSRTRFPLAVSRSPESAESSARPPSQTTPRTSLLRSVWVVLCSKGFGRKGVMKSGTYWRNVYTTSM